MVHLVRPARAGDEAAVLALLAQHPDLERAFVAAEFLVALDGARLVGCARLHRHVDGSLELASVAVDAQAQRSGTGSVLVRALLAGASQSVYALALAPGFFARFGFREAARDRLPPPVKAKADGMCASKPFVVMVRP